jgi:hypothetical protein
MFVKTDAAPPFPPIVTTTPLKIVTLFAAMSTAEL